jgi:hypothetical protein
MCDRPQFSLGNLLGITFVIAVLLGVGVNTTDKGVWFACLVSPFFVVLWVLWLLFCGRKNLAIAYTVFHSLVATAFGAWVFSTTDGEERWGRSLILLAIDLPVTLWFLRWEPPQIVAATVVFVGGGAFWGKVGYAIARRKKSQKLLH